MDKSTKEHLVLTPVERKRVLDDLEHRWYVAMTITQADKILSEGEFLQIFSRIMNRRRDGLG